MSSVDGVCSLSWYFCSKITWFEINGEELILCESYCIVLNREYDEWCMDIFLMMETMYNLEVSVSLSFMNMLF